MILGKIRTLCDVMCICDYGYYLIPHCNKEI